MAHSGHPQFRTCRSASSTSWKNPVRPQTRDSRADQESPRAPKRAERGPPSLVVLRIADVRLQGAHVRKRKKGGSISQSRTSLAHRSAKLRGGVATWRDIQTAPSGAPDWPRGPGRLKGLTCRHTLFGDRAIVRGGVTKREIKRKRVSSLARTRVTLGVAIHRKVASAMVRRRGGGGRRFATAIIARDVPKDAAEPEPESTNHVPNPAVNRTVRVEAKVVSRPRTFHQAVGISKHQQKSATNDPLAVQETLPQRERERSDSHPPTDTDEIGFVPPRLSLESKHESGKGEAGRAEDLHCGVAHITQSAKTFLFFPLGKHMRLTRPIRRNPLPLHPPLLFRSPNRSTLPQNSRQSTNDADFERGRSEELDRVGEETEVEAFVTWGEAEPFPFGRGGGGAAAGLCWGGGGGGFSCSGWGGRMREEEGRLRRSRRRARRRTSQTRTLLVQTRRHKWWRRRRGRMRSKVSTAFAECRRVIRSSITTRRNCGRGRMRRRRKPTRQRRRAFLEVSFRR